MIGTLVTSIMAGLLISIGCCAYASVPNHIVGSLLFSFGLMSVIQYKLSLYTGMVGCWGRGISAGTLLLVFMGNLIGCAFLCLVTAQSGMPFVQQLAAIADAKLAARPFHSILAAAIVCGALMEIGVGVWRKGSVAHAAKSFITVAAVMIFILTGAEHSIANAFYVLFSDVPLLDRALFILLCAVGNAIGGVLANRGAGC